MQGHGADLANVVIGNRVVLFSVALADPKFERENGIGNFLDDTDAVSVVANAMEVNAHVPPDVRLENVPQLAIHKLKRNCLHQARLQTSCSFPISHHSLLANHALSFGLSSLTSDLRA
jgi:hypothetical protein